MTWVHRLTAALRLMHHDINRELAAVVQLLGAMPPSSGR